MDNSLDSTQEYCQECYSNSNRWCSSLESCKSLVLTSGDNAKSVYHLDSLCPMVQVYAILSNSVFPSSFWKKKNNVIPFLWFVFEMLYFSFILVLCQGTLGSLEPLVNTICDDFIEGKQNLMFCWS